MKLEDFLDSKGSVVLCDRILYTLLWVHVRHLEVVRGWIGLLDGSQAEVAALSELRCMLSVRLYFARSNIPIHVMVVNDRK